MADGNMNALHYLTPGGIDWEPKPIGCDVWPHNLAFRVDTASRRH